MSRDNYPARLLAIDTSSDQVHLGLGTPAGQWIAALPGGAQASATLLPSIMDLLAQAGLRLSELDAIAYGQGPGAFTGVRTACAIAQGLALGAQLPVLALDSLQAVAQDLSEAVLSAQVQTLEPRCCVMVDARMQEVYTAMYQRREGRWQPSSAPRVLKPEVLAEQLQALALDIWVGNALEIYAAQWLACHRGAPLQIAQLRPSGNALLELAAQAWEDGLAIDAAQALPVYVRDKVAQTTAERMAQEDLALSGAAKPL